jgi:hypothetical protein
MTGIVRGLANQLGKPLLIRSIGLGVGVTAWGIAMAAIGAPNLNHVLGRSAIAKPPTGCGEFSNTRRVSRPWLSRPGRQPCPKKPNPSAKR